MQFRLLQLVLIQKLQNQNWFFLEQRRRMVFRVFGRNGTLFGESNMALCTGILIARPFIEARTIDSTSMGAKSPNVWTSRSAKSCFDAGINPIRA
jgi:hypothetical protein